MEEYKWNGRIFLKLYWLVAAILIFTATFISFQSVRYQYTLSCYSSIGYLVSKQGGVDNDILNEMLSGTENSSYIKQGKSYLEQNGYKDISNLFFEEQLNRSLIPLLITLLVIFSLYYLYISALQKRLGLFIHKLGQWIDDFNPLVFQKLEKTFQNKNLNYLMEIINKKCLHIYQGLDNLKLENQKTSVYVDDVLHQLKTPLATLQLVIERLLMSEENPSRTLKLNEACRQIDKMSLMIKELLRLSRLKSGKSVFQMDTYDFSRTITQILDFISPLAEKKNIQITCQRQFQMEFEYDEMWLKECILNIIKNCIEYSEENTKIRIAYEKTHHYHEISISDEGKGIEENEKELIFSRFYTNDFSHVNDSTGIGLSLAKEIVLRHHGKLWVENNDIKGVTFSIILPVLTGTEPYDTYFFQKNP